MKNYSTLILLSFLCSFSLELLAGKKDRYDVAVLALFPNTNHCDTTAQKKAEEKFLDNLRAQKKDHRRAQKNIEHHANSAGQSKQIKSGRKKK